MALCLSLILTLLTCVLAVAAVTANNTHYETKRACSVIGDTAIVRSVLSWVLGSCPDLPPQSQSVATKLQATYFNSSLGYYSGDRKWTDAVSYFLHGLTANI